MVEGCRTLLNDDESEHVAPSFTPLCVQMIKVGLLSFSKLQTRAVQQQVEFIRSAPILLLCCLCAASSVITMAATKNWSTRLLFPHYIPREKLEWILCTGDMKDIRETLLYDESIGPHHGDDSLARATDRMMNLCGKYWRMVLEQQYAPLDMYSLDGCYRNYLVDHLRERLEAFMGIENGSSDLEKLGGVVTRRLQEEQLESKALMEMLHQIVWDDVYHGR